MSETVRLSQMSSMNLIETSDLGEGFNLRNEITYHLGGLPFESPTDIRDGLGGKLSRKRQDLFNKAYLKELDIIRKRRATAIGEDTPIERDPPLTDLTLAGEPSSNVNEEAEEDLLLHTVPEENMEVKIARKLPRFTKTLNSAIHFCVFNVGTITKAEFWNVLKGVLSPEILKGVTRVQNVDQPNGRKRMDMWVEAKVASRLKQAMYLTSKQRRNGEKVDHKYPTRKLKGLWLPTRRTIQWRIDVYRQYRDKEAEPRFPKSDPLPQTRRAIATFNLNGLKNKKGELVQFLIDKRVGVAALQETLIGDNEYRIQLPDYNVYQRSRTDDFRGQAIAIYKSYTSFEVGNSKEKHYIHVKVIGLIEKTTWHIISVYLPSGGNHRHNRTERLRDVLQLYAKIREKEPKARVVILGDFNMARSDLETKIKSKKSKLSVVKIAGNGLTFHRKSTKWSDLDSIIASPEAKVDICPAKVYRSWGAGENDSDHFPLVATVRAKQTSYIMDGPQRTKFNLDLLKGQGDRIVNSNRWSLLPIEEITTAEELNSTAEQFTKTVNEIGLESGIKQYLPDKMYTLDRRLKKEVRKAGKLRQKWIRLAKNGNVKDAENAHKVWFELKKKIRKALISKERALEAKSVKKANEWYRDNDMRSFHKWETAHTVNGGKISNAITPIIDKEGTLLTEKEDILNRTTEYFQELSQDDPENLSQDKEYWEGKMGPELEALPCNEAFTWQEVLLAIRGMMLGTACGSDEIPIEVYKALLKEECHRQAEALGQTVLENTYKALPAHQLPASPLTPMGKSLYNVIKGMWDVEAQPKCWDTVTNIPLHKSGDPTDLLNYRGISLIAVGMKIFTVMVAMRLSNLMEVNHLFIDEQGGFRQGQEAIAQFVALAEIVRRRHLSDKKTWIIFIDFKKAFDKVMHEALFEKLSALGIRGKLLNIIKEIYSTSYASAKVGGINGKAYRMKRGTRQGCPLSPILFIIFINDILNHLPEGAQVPGIKTGPKTCKGLLFADDVANLVEKQEMVQPTLDKITEWSNKWKLPIGAPKCGVMMAGGSEAEQKALAEENFYLDGQKISVVRSYKYLGIVITDKLSQTDSDEKAHCKVLASRVKKATDMRRGFLRDNRIPIGIKIAVVNSKIAPIGCYGGEWVGMCQDRTAPIQKELNIALKLILNSSSKSNLHSTQTMALELNVPTIEQRMFAMRTRLWQKAPGMKTWLQYLVLEENKFTSKKATWASGTKKYLQRMTGRHNLPKERNDLDDRVETLMKKDKDYEATRGIEWDDNETKLQGTISVVARALYKDMYGGSKVVKATTNYMTFGFDRTRDWIKAAVYLPELTEGTIWLARLRTGGWWTTKRRHGALVSKGIETELDPRLCPCCNKLLRAEDEPELCHIILDCEEWNKQRKALLEPILKLIWMRVTHPERRMATSKTRLEVVIRALGGDITSSDTVLAYQNATTEQENIPDATVLDLFAKGWGGEPGSYTPGLNAHAYTVMARYLQYVMPKHKAILFRKDEETAGLPRRLEYEPSENEESPIRGLPRGKPTNDDDMGSVWGGDSDADNNEHLDFYNRSRLTTAIQANAQSGMGSRCLLRRLKGVPDALRLAESDEESGDEVEPGYEDMPGIVYLDL